MLGPPLAQARAARTRQAIVRAMQSAGRWLDEDPDEGVHPSGYDEGAADFEERLEFYAPRQIGGDHAQARGVWPLCLTELTRIPRAVALQRARRRGEEAPCAVAEISVVDFEPTSNFAL